MKKSFLVFAAFLCAATLNARAAFDEDLQEPIPVPEEAAEPSLEAISYAFGVVLGSQFKDAGLEFNYDELGKGFKDAVQGSTRVSETEAVDLAQSAYAAAWEAKALENKQKEDSFLANNATKDGVTITESGLQYEVLIEGEGAKPLATDMVQVNYEGKLIDGTVFDSSYRRGESAEFSLDMVIDGWSEGLQLMSVGSKYRLVIPSALAYGESGAGAVIPPYSPLIFEVELLAILEYPSDFDFDYEDPEAYSEDIEETEE